MKQKKLEVFVDAATHYFNQLGLKGATVGTPFLTQSINDHLMDYTGIIGISGNHKGSIFVSAPSILLTRILRLMGIFDFSEDQLMDLAGEISNTVSGNARREFGKDFMLSVPFVVKGKSENIKASKITEIYVIPIIWEANRANIVINLASEKS